jgi:tetratricopeptide (TPR) repeat protein
LAEAAQDARAGRYADAEAILRQLRSHGPASAAQLDLLARIRAQQGDPAQAAALWEQALVLEPGREAYRAGLEQARRAGDRPAWLIRAAIGGLTLLLVLVAAGASALLLTRESSSSSVDARGPAPATKHAGRAAASWREQLAAALKLPGVATTSLGPGAIAVTFEDGLFATAIELSPSGRRLLGSVGGRLDRFAGRATVDVIDRSDGAIASPFTSRAQLRGARAGAVDAALRSGKAPESMLDIGLGRRTPVPIPKTTAGARGHSTVLLLIAATGP